MLLPIISFAQEEKVISHKKEDIKKAKQEAKLKAKEQISQLHNGILLVRLSTRKKSIAAMRKANKNELANKTENKLRKKNIEIISAFKSNFDFCPVYFFYSDYSKYVRKNQLDSVVFLNDSLQPDSNIKVANKKFLTAQFGTTEPDTKTYSSYTHFDKGEKTTTYYGGSALTLNALVMKNNQLEQLRKPFPYYVREYPNPVTHRSVYKMVLIMNYKLNHYYRKTNK